jgi:hypothetical protein
MAFSGDGRKLTGSDGTIYKGELGAEIAGDGVTALPEGEYIVTSVAGTSSFPAPALGGTTIRVGDYLVVKSGDTITPAVDDDVKPVTLSELCDVTSWTLPFTKEEIETTTFCDDIKTYETGKADAQGTLSGITTIGTTTDEGGFLNQFIDVIKQDGDTSYDVFESSADLLLAKLVANKNNNKGDDIFVFAPVNVYGASIGGDQASAQTFDSNFRFASSAEVNVGLYRVAVA